MLYFYRKEIRWRNEKELRLIEILKILLNNENYLKAKDIASKLGVTIRTIYSDLDSPELNKIIYPGFIEKKTNKGIRIQIDPITKK